MEEDMMERMLATMTVVLMTSLHVAGANEGIPMLPSEKAKMVPVFAAAWSSDENVVGIYSPPETSDMEYWGTKEHLAEWDEMNQKGYYPLHLRERLKGNPPALIYHNHVMGVCGNASTKPLFMVEGAYMVFVLRRYSPESVAKDALLFPTSASEDTNEPYMVEEGYAGVGCLKWPEKLPWGAPSPEMPAWYVRFSEDEIEDFRRCGEWCVGDENKSPMTPWGRELQKWARMRCSPSP